MATVAAIDVPKRLRALTLAVLCLMTTQLALASCTPDWAETPALQGAMRVSAPPR
jgi:hypothetical protein